MRPLAVAAIVVATLTACAADVGTGLANSDVDPIDAATSETATSEASTPAASDTAAGDSDLSYFDGTWYAYGYGCGAIGGANSVDEQILEIEIEEMRFVATKTIGDDCVRAGEISFIGRWNGQGWEADFYTRNIGSPNPPDITVFEEPITIESDRRFTALSISFERDQRPQ